MKRMIAIILAVLMLTGCQLAGRETDQNRDKMVGVFVTVESLDLEFDIQALLEDHPYALHGDGVDISDPKYVEYAGKLPVTVTEDGWEVPGYKGVYFGQRLKGNQADPVFNSGVAKLSSHITAGDVVESVEMEGTIYFPEGTEIEIYTNPVYMTEAGECYVVEGDSLRSIMGLGGICSPISQELKWTEKGERNSYRAEFMTTIQGITLVETVKLIWRGENHVEISRMVCAPGQMPDSIDAEGASLVVIEEIGGQVVNREVYEPGDETVSLFYQNEDEPWCRKHIMQINWPE